MLPLPWGKGFCGPLVSLELISKINFRPEPEREECKLDSTPTLGFQQRIYIEITSSKLRRRKLEAPDILPNQIIF